MFGFEKRRGKREKGGGCSQGAPVWNRVAGEKNGSQSENWNGRVIVWGKVGKWDVEKRKRGEGSRYEGIDREGESIDRSERGD